MPIDLLALAAELIAGEGLELVKDKAKRHEGVLRTLTKLGFKLDSPPSNDFDGVYAYTLVLYAIDKPKPVVDFFRDTIIKNAFHKSFSTRNLNILDEETEHYLEWSEVGKKLRKMDYDPRGQFTEFMEKFITYAKLTRSIPEELTDQAIEEINKAVQELPTITDFAAGIAPLGKKLEDIFEAVTKPLKESSSHENLLAEIKSNIENRRVVNPYLFLQDFLGREHELKHLREYWDTGKKNVVIHGLAGIGKSSLVSYFLEHVLKILPVRVFRHDFRLSPDFPSFARYLGNFLSLKPPTSDDPQEYVSALINGLNNTNLVLFFDNFEEVLRDSDEISNSKLRPLKIKDQNLSSFIDNLLRGQTGVNIYITSRYQPDFGLAGSNCVYLSDTESLAGLDKDNSKKLLDLRTGGIQISEDDWGNINQILNGHPAATELLGQILKDQVYEIDDLITRFENISTTETDTPFIERISEDLFDTLYDRLNNLEKLCLRRMSTLRIPFDYTAVSALASITILQAKENIEALWKRNLLQRQTTN